MRNGWTLLLAVLAICYPVAVYLGLQYLEPRIIGALLAVVFGLRLLLSRETLLHHLDTLMPVVVLALLCSLGAVILNSHASLRLTPAFINFTSMVVFGVTLWRGRPMIERFARLAEPDLDAEGVRYTRIVTRIWCLFFFCNGCIALYTALFTSLEVWALYNGLIAYGLMGLLFAGEYLVRRRVRGGRAP